MIKLSSNNGYINIKILEVTQPIGAFYVGVIDANDLEYISHVDTRALLKLEEYENRDVFAQYMGIQRPLDPERVKEIKQYVNTIDSSFPNTIIVAIKSEDVVFKNEGHLKVKRKPDVVTIIDGQHRLSGFIENNVENFQLIITIFLDLELEEQAYIFSTINTKHRKINPSLAKDLLEFSKVETPEKLAHNIAKKLNSESNSPWYRQIKMLGRKDELSEGIISQHTFTKEIINLIYDDKNHPIVRDILKRHNNKRKYLNRFNEKFKKYPFWNFYVDNQDDIIYTSLFNYFTIFQDTFSNEWHNKNYILTKTTGYSAIMQGLSKILPIGINEKKLSKSFFQQYIQNAKEKLTMSKKSLTNIEFPAGDEGKKELYKIMFGDIY